VARVEIIHQSLSLAKVFPEENQIDKFLQHMDDGEHRWEPGNYFKNLKKK